MIAGLTSLFLTLLNMSITASWVILAVFAARWLLQKAPKRVTYWLWAVVLFRLLCPFSWQSIFSLIPSAQTVSANILYSETPTIQSGIPALDTAINPVLPAGAAKASVNPLQLWAAAGALVWAAGVVCLFGYSAVTAGRWFAALKKAQPHDRENLRVRVLPGLRSPFVFGLLRPAIFLPEKLSDEKIAFILAHEKAHLRRGDSYAKPLAWVAACLHWFNPLVWAAFFAFEKDMELSCDEIVVRTYTEEQRKAYSKTLLELAAAHRFVGGCPLAFGESNIKSRIKNILHTKKTAAWVAAAAVILVAVLCVSLALNPLTNLTADSLVSASTAPEQQESSGKVPSPTAEEVSADSTAWPDKTEPLTEENTSSFIRATLESLTLHENNTVTFQLPDAIPTDPAGATKLTISLYLSYQVEEGVNDNPELLDWATDWHGGEVFTGTIEPERGTLTEVMLRVAFMTLVEETADGAAYEEYDADYTRLTAPFTYEQGPVVAAPGAALLPSNGMTTVNYTLKNGKDLSVSCTMPGGLKLTTEVPKDSIPDDSDFQNNGSELPVVFVVKGNAVVGTLSLFDYATNNKTDLANVDTAANSIPMAVYGTVNLSNHADYGEHYRVVSHTATSSNAVTKYQWQDLGTPGNDGAAADLPFQREDCVLAFHLDTEPYFTVFKLKEGVLTEEQLTDFAKSVKLS